MRQTEISEGFNQMIAAAVAAGNATAVAHMELAREYFTNPAFKAAIEEYVWQNSQARE